MAFIAFLFPLLSVAQLLVLKFAQVRMVALFDHEEIGSNSSGVRGALVAMYAEQLEKSVMRVRPVNCGVVKVCVCVCVCVCVSKSSAVVNPSLWLCLPLHTDLPHRRVQAPT